MQLSLEEMRDEATRSPQLNYADLSNPHGPLSEPMRLAQREHVKQQIAEAKAKAQQAGVLARKLAEIDLEADAAADVHGQTVAPLRNRLQEIDAETQRLFMLHQPVPTELVDEQAGLMGQIEQAGQVLKDAVDKVKLRRKPVAAELHRLRLQSGHQHLVNQLTNGQLGNPDLLDQQWALNKLFTLFSSAVHAVANKQRTLGNHCPHKPQRYDIAAERGRKVLDELESELAELREKLIAE